MNRSSSIVALMLLALLASSCRKGEHRNVPRATADDCEPLCERITECGPSMVSVLMPGKEFETDKVRKRAMRAFTNKESCIKSCTAHIKHPEKGRTYAAFVAAQLPCLKEESCVDFAKCLWEATQRMTLDYPLGDRESYLCREVCRMQKRCSKELLTVLAGSEYTKASPDTQAEMERRMEQEKKCIIACRRYVIENSKLDPFATKGAACLNQQNCDEYAKCIAQQIPSGP